MTGGSDLAEQLADGAAGLIRGSRRISCALPLPSRDDVHSVLDELRTILFPGYFGDSDVSPQSLPDHLGSALDRVRRSLREQAKRGFCFVCAEEDPRPTCEQTADAVTAAFLAGLPQLQRTLAADVRAAYEGDPAATSPAEVIFCYPGLLAITDFRIAHELDALAVPILPRMMTEHAHGLTGIDIHPGASIGESFFIDHGTGVVLGETCVIRDRVRIYQGVTLGAKSFPLDERGKPVKGVPRHPIIEDDVVIYAGATILGRVTIGKGSTVGGNVWLTRSVPAGSVITQQRPREEAFERGSGI